MVMIVNKDPHHSVVKEVICNNCGVTLSYVPDDIKKEQICDYTGHYETRKYIICPSCSKEIKV
mgnify:CR=1 FL=1